MTPATTARPRAPRLALALALAAWLAGCGPGVEGTGTGATADDPLKSFGATAVSACGSPLAPQLAACIKGQAVRYADSTTQPHVTAEIQDGLAQLRAPCAGLQFSGEWAAVGSQAPRFYGTVTSASGTALASLIVSAEGVDGLRIEMRSAIELPLLGPLSLVPAGPSAVVIGCS